MRTNPRGMIDVNQPIEKRLVAFNAEDLKLLREIFPENGAQTYLPGLLVKIFLKQLKEKDINGFYDRVSGGHYNYSSIIPDYELVRDEVR